MGKSHVLEARSRKFLRISHVHKGDKANMNGGPLGIPLCPIFSTRPLLLLLLLQGFDQSAAQYAFKYSETYQAVGYCNSDIRNNSGLGCIAATLFGGQCVEDAASKACFNGNPADESSTLGAHGIVRLATRRSRSKTEFMTSSHHLIHTALFVMSFSVAPKVCKTCRT